ncbi:MAG: UbiD family decarboxylase [Deltaproteobacteria bacterium]|nr:UbiD family decarboxylase [Deltaproteobacteria bacterium]MBW2070593.1 UbiD family decarboxylase [Deltaproteobacteria bacterium]
MKRFAALLIIAAAAVVLLAGCGRRAVKTSEASTPDEVARRLVDLTACIEYLEDTGNLVRVKSEVDPEYELAGIAKKYEGKKCVLFEKVKGSDYPVFIGLLWNRDIVASIFGVPREKVPFVIGGAIGQWKRNKEAMESPILDKGPANEVIEKDVDLYKLPVPIHALKDGGRYFDSSVVIARNPETGKLNISIHRLMITGKDRLTFLIDPGRHLGAYLEVMEKRNMPLQVTINNGISLAPWLNSAIPRQGDGKYKIAHHIIGRPINLLKAQTVDVPAYADAQFVIEAEILPNLREDEGPFAEVTGYYAKRDKRWVMRVKAITHRRNPVFHTLLSGQEVWNAVGFTAEAKIFVTVKKKVPQLRAVYLTPGGCGFYGAVVQVEKDGAMVGRQAIMETFKAFKPLQRVVAVDTDVNLYDPIDVNWALTTRFNPDTDLIILPNQWGHILNPMVKVNADGKGGTVTKIGMDATCPFPRTERFERVDFKKVDLNNYQISQ